MGSVGWGREAREMTGLPAEGVVWVGKGQGRRGSSEINDVGSEWKRGEKRAGGGGGKKAKEKKAV